MKQMKTIMFLILLLWASADTWAEVSLPKIFSSNMVLQREIDIPVWGTADSGERITVTFNGTTVRTRTGRMVSGR